MRGVRIPGVPGVPVGGVAGGVGVTLRVVSCACVVRGTLQSNAPAAKRSLARRDQRSVERVELVVFVSLTHERTVYFTP